MTKLVHKYKCFRTSLHKQLSSDSDSDICLCEDTKVQQIIFEFRLK